jgi:hypothetical protein
MAFTSCATGMGCCAAGAAAGPPPPPPPPPPLPPSGLRLRASWSHSLMVRLADPLAAGALVDWAVVIAV